MNQLLLLAVPLCPVCVEKIIDWNGIIIGHNRTTDLLDTRWQCIKIPHALHGAICLAGRGAYIGEQQQQHNHE